MKINKVNATFFQNKFNYYIGDIIIDETLYIEDDYIIIGNIKTPNNIVSKGNLIVIGDITARSLYGFKDVFCRGEMDIDIEEIEGKLNQFEIKTIHKVEKTSEINIRNEIYNEEIDNKKDNSKKNIQQDIKPHILSTINRISDEVDNRNITKNNTKIKRIYDINDIEVGDIIKHNTLGEGKVLNVTNYKIYIDFIKKGKRYISTNITLQLGLLKKYIDGENKFNFKKETGKINKINDIHIKDNKKIKIKCSENLSEEELYLNKICKNKSITFWSKYINEYNLDIDDQALNKYKIHYIKFKGVPYIRLNQICYILSIPSNKLEKFTIDENIKVSYKDRGTNGIKFITLKDLYRIINSCNIETNIRNIFNDVILNIEKNCKENLENAIPYWSETIENILKHKNMNMDEIAKEWNVNIIQIKVVKNGFTPQLTKIKQLIKENEIISLTNSSYNRSNNKYNYKMKDNKQCIYKFNEIKDKNIVKNTVANDNTVNRLNNKTEKNIVNSSIKREFLSQREISNLYKKDSIGFKEDSIYEFCFGIIDNKYKELNFDYIKYNDKIYARLGHINNILSTTLYIEDIIKVRYVDKSISNVKFASMKNILKSINKLNRDGVDESKIVAVEKSIDTILKNKSLTKTSLPYWSLILDSILNDLKLKIEDLYEKFLIDEYDIELMSVGFPPVKKESKDRLNKLL